MGAPGLDVALEAFLAEGAKNGTLRRHLGRVSRIAIKQRLGIDVRLLARDDRLRTILSRYDDHLSPEGIERSLEAWLEAGLNDGTLPTHRRLVRRDVVCARFGISQNALRNHGSYWTLVKRYDGLLASREEPGPVSVKRLQAWLDQGLKKGTLPLHGGKVRRAAAASLLGWSSSRLFSSAQCMSRLHDCDAKLAALPARSRSRKDLKLRLQSLLRNGQVRTKNLKISRSALCKSLGLTASQFEHEEALRRMVAEHESILLRQVENRLSDYLEKQFAVGAIPLHKGAVSRKMVASHFRLATSTLVGDPTLQKVLARFDARVQSGYQAGRPVISEDVQRFDNWLAEGFREGTLRTSAKGISRTAASKFLGISCAQLSATPQFMALLSRYDAVVREGYVIDEDRSRLKSLCRLLMSKKCPKTRSGTEIDRGRVAAKIGITASRLMMPPFRDYVLARDEQLIASAKNDPVDPYYCGRRFVLSTFGRSLPRSFLEVLSANFKVAYEDAPKERRSKSFIHLKRLLDVIASHKGAAAVEARKSIASNEIVPRDSWAGVLAVRRDQITSSNTVHGAKSAAVTELRKIASLMADAGLVPETDVVWRYRRGAGRGAGKAPTLVEAPLKSSQSSRVDDYLAFAQRILPEAALRLNVCIDGDSLAFMQGLRDELERKGKTLDHRPEIAIRDLLKSRLSAVTSLAEATLVKCMDKAAQREDLNRHQTLDVSTFDRAFQERSHGKQGVFRRTFFPARSEVGLANLLAVIESKFSGMTPCTTDASISRELHSFLNAALYEQGGAANVDAYLHPPREAYAAAIMLYLCQSGANVSVARTLPINCIELVDDDRSVLVTGVKERAKGKAIYAEFRKDALLIRAMRWIRQDLASRPYASEVGSLFTVRVGMRHQCFTENQLRGWFERICEEDPALDGLSLTPRMIRPTILLLHALEHDGKYRIGMAVGQHGEQVSEGYQSRWPTRVLYDQNIRRFQYSLEGLVTENIHGAALRLGISDEEFSSRIDAVRRTGLGTFCAKSLNGGEASSHVCKNPNCWDDCPNMIFIAEVESVVTVQLWQKALKAAAPEWERDRPERWDSVWLPWLCMFDVIEEKMARGSHLGVWVAAAARRAAYEANASFVPPSPW